MAEVGKLRKLGVVLAACWAGPGAIWCAVSLDDWLGPEGIVVAIALIVVAVPWTVLPVAVSLCGLRASHASGARWRVIAVWAGLGCAGVALEIALLRTIGAQTGVPLPSWEGRLWIGYATVGVLMIALLWRIGRDRLPVPSPGFVWRHARGAGLALAGALVIVSVSAPAFIAAEVTDLESVHHVNRGETVTMNLAPGSYDLDGGSDPAGGYSGNASDFSVTGAQGQVAVRTVPFELSGGDWGRMFLDVGDLTPAAYFTVTEPGAYRVSVAPDNDDFVNNALVSDPYGAVLARTGPWAAGMLASLGVLAACWGRIRRTQRVALACSPLKDQRPL